MALTPTIKNYLKKKKKRKKRLPELPSICFNGQPQLPLGQWCKLFLTAEKGIMSITVTQNFFQLNSTKKFWDINIVIHFTTTCTCVKWQLDYFSPNFSNDSECKWCNSITYWQIMQIIAKCMVKDVWCVLGRIETLTNCVASK